MRLVTGIFLAVWASLAQTADLSVRVQGAPADGMLVFQVYDSPNAFGDFRDPVKEIHTPIQTGALYQIDDIRSGDIAVLVYVDENENSLLDKNFIGIPKEPLGISNNYRPKGPPAFGRAKFTISEGKSTTIDIEMYKVLGERGRLGVGAGVASFIELTEDWRIVLSLSAEFLPDEIVSSPIVTDDRIMKGFAAITYVF